MVRVLQQEAAHEVFGAVDVTLRQQVGSLCNGCGQLLQPGGIGERDACIRLVALRPEQLAERIPAGEQGAVQHHSLLVGGNRGRCLAHRPQAVTALLEEATEVGVEVGKRLERAQRICNAPTVALAHGHQIEHIAVLGRLHAECSRGSEAFAEPTLLHKPAYTVNLGLYLRDALDRPSGHHARNLLSPRTPEYGGNAAERTGAHLRANGVTAGSARESRARRGQPR